MYTTIRTIIEEAMANFNESFDDVEFCSLKDSELDDWFYNERTDDGLPSGNAFNVWTHNRVYLSICYTGRIGCASVSRNPIKTNNMGWGVCMVPLRD